MVRQAFSFLESAGFKLEQCDPGRRVRYRSTRAIVDVEWVVRSGDVDVYFALPPQEGERDQFYALDDLLRMEHVEDRTPRRPFDIPEEDSIAPFIEKLAEETRKHAQPALAGDPVFFGRLAEQRKEIIRDAERAMDLHRARWAAEHPPSALERLASTVKAWFSK
jgi:hypothetical protein